MAHRTQADALEIKARQIRDAEAADPGVIRRTLDARLAQGKEPNQGGPCAPQILVRTGRAIPVGFRLDGS